MGKRIVSYGTLKIINGSREPVVELKNGHCTVKTVQLSMSKKHMFALIIDLLLIGIMPIFCLGCSLFVESKASKVLAMVCATLLSVIWILNTIIDFRNWFYTKNKQLEKMGEWCLEDCANIINDLLNAGSKGCSQMVEEERRRNIESSKSQNKQGVCS